MNSGGFAHYYYHEVKISDLPGEEEKVRNLVSYRKVRRTNEGA